MTLWVTLEYLKNEDVIEISYRKFDQTKGDSQYPSMSLCFVDSYKHSVFENAHHSKKDKNINTTSYDNFINGDVWDENMLKVKYANVTLDLKEGLETVMTLLLLGWEPIV